jgi:hypothetical protein
MPAVRREMGLRELCAFQSYESQRFSPDFIDLQRNNLSLTVGLSWQEENFFLYKKRENFLSSAAP